MKLTLYALLFISTLFPSVSSAQWDLMAGQRFNPAIERKPFIGFDLVRSFYPSIIIQTKDANAAWQDSLKYITQPAPFSDKMFLELGYYGVDSPTKPWVSSQVDKYDISYNYTQKKVTSVNHSSRSTPSNYSVDFKYTYTFSPTQAYPDSEIIELLNGSTYVPSASRAFFYDSQNRITLQKHTAASGFRYDVHYVYNSEGKLVSELAMAAFQPNMPFDSSSRRTYLYDSSGRLKEFISEIYELVGSPYTWTINSRIEYVYGANGLMKENHLWTYDYQSNYEQVRYFDYEYQWSFDGKLAEYVQVIYNPDGTFNTKDKVLVFYDTDGKATHGYEYPWNGTAYGSVPTYKYLFGDIPTALADVNIGQQVKLYPNPCAHSLYVNVQGVNQGDIMDITGRQIASGLPVTNGKMDVSSIPPGIYLLALKGTKPVRFVKE